jgi:hypothetical protein
MYSFSLADEKVIKMGYKSISKMPLIGEGNDNSGLYLELFNKAAKKIGYRLEIERLPKIRLHLALEEGDIDFYPGSSFSQKRATYLYYLENGLETKEVLVSLDSKEEIFSMYEAKGILIVELGSSKIEWDKKYRNLKIIQLGKLSMTTVVNALKFNRGDFYVADIEIVNYFKKINGLKNYKELGLKIHNEAITKEFIPMHMGFSRKSKLFKEKSNPDFNRKEAISIENFPTIVDENSVAFKFYQALHELKDEEETKKLYMKYFQ